jgi:hypothetical protein
MPEGGACALQEPAFAPGAAQGIGTDHAYAVRMHGAQPLPEPFEAAQCPVRGRIVQPPAVGEAPGQADHFPQSIEDDELAVRMTRNDHVKAIGPQVDGGEHVGHDTTAAHHTTDTLPRHF